jgi:Protein of unknown function (DUF4242)
MLKYLTIHKETHLDRVLLESRWINLAQERAGTWVKTWFNLQSGRRFCWWDSPSKETVRKTIQKHGVSWEDIIQVGLTTPSEWRWRED